MARFEKKTEVTEIVVTLSVAEFKTIRAALAILAQGYFNPPYPDELAPHRVGVADLHYGFHMLAIEQTNQGDN